MNKQLHLLLLFVSGTLILSCDRSDNSAIKPEFPCVDGISADTYPCNNVALYSRVTPQDLGGTFLNDIWGWKDPATGKEYALVGLTDGVSFVDISDPNNPVVVGKLAEHISSAKAKVELTQEDYIACLLGIGSTELAKSVQEGTTWRDMKVYNNHLFVVRDGVGDGNSSHGMQVFDLTRLRDFSGDFLNFNEDSHYNRFNTAHNITINEETGFAYASGVISAEICGSRQETGLHIVDIRDPKNPVYAGCYFDPETELDNGFSAGTGYIHDTQCVIYDGPDTDYSGKELCFSSAEGAVVISDVTDKANPSTVGFSGQSEMQYSHQGWLTEDHAYFLMNDEIDEANLGRNTKTYVWDVRDLQNPVFVDHFTHTTTSIDHNLYVKDNYVFESNYTSGLRILELGNLANAEMSLVAYFDTQPLRDTSDPGAGGFTGTWSSYPYFDSGVVIVSDIADGLFILKPELD